MEHNPLLALQALPAHSYDYCILSSEEGVEVVSCESFKPKEETLLAVSPTGCFTTISGKNQVIMSIEVEDELHGPSQFK